MKEHAKKALKHDTKVLGKTVPTMLIIGLFLVGGGSAAILSSFGTVSGTADVEQSIEIEGSSGKATLGFFGASSGGTSDVTAGTVSTDTFTVDNNMNRSYTLSFTSYPGETSVQDTGGQSGTQFKWAGDGIRTSFVEYYPEAGTDFSSYSESAGISDIIVGSSSEANYSGIQTAIDNAVDRDTIYVETGTYTEFNVNKNVSIVGLNDPTGNSPAEVEINKSEGERVDINSGGVTVRGINFEGVAGTNSANMYVASGSGATITIEDNYFEDVGMNTDDSNYEHAMKVSDTGSDVVIDNNQVDGFSHGVQISQFANQEVDITDNDFQNQALDGIFVTVKNNHDANVDIQSNIIDTNEYGVLMTQDGSTDADIEMTSNRFGENPVDITARTLPSSGFTVKDSVSGTFEANNNFFEQGTWNSVSNGNIEGGFSASYKQIGSIPADSTETVAAVNEFALMLDGSQDYDLTTAIS